MNSLTFIIELLFIVLFLATLVGWLRRRDELSLDVMLIFGSLAGLFVIAGISALVGTLPDLVIGVAFALLLAHPVFTLRLAHRLRPIAMPVRVGAAVLWAATALPLLVLPLREGGAAPLFAGIGVFVVTEVVAASYLWREYRRRRGAARRRILTAAAGTLLMALALAGAVLVPTIPGLGVTGSDVGRVLGLLSAILYLFAFVPPAWARRLGNAVTSYEFTKELLDGSFGEGADAVWARLAGIGRSTTGATVAIVVIGEPPVTVARVGGGGPGDDLGPTLDVVPQTSDGRRIQDGDGRLAELARRLDAPHLTVLPLDLAGDEPGALILLRDRPSLFAADDHGILIDLIARARVFAERSEAMKEQEALTNRLRATVEALERASQAKSDFLASMSHELRTPLSAIIGFSALMRDEPMTGDKRAVPDEWIEHVHRSGDHLLALINDVLDLTKIEAGRIDLARDPFDLGTALAESVEGLRPLAARKSIEMVLDAQHGIISADRGRVRQIVYNLLSNAIKFTPDGGRVSVEALWSGNDATIAVSDSGVGIDAGDLERIFEEFSQVGDMKAREAGTGLGLALSRRLVEAHGGRISVTSTPGAGSRFEAVFPDSRATDPEVVAPSVPAEPHVAGATVLVIEDDPGAVRLLRTYLETDGYRVVVATDGEAGIAAARAHSPGAIILDVLLPGFDGWEVLRRLKADPKLRDIPVMVATVVDERNVAMSLGAVDYFLKPVRPDALLARLATYTFTTKVKQRNVRVLVIDDEQSARDLVAGSLRPEGFEVITAASGDEGLALAVAQPPDLVICDLVMPDMDGFEVVSRLSASEMPKDVPILILTGQTLTDADRDRLNGKVMEVMQKGDDFRPALSRWLRRAAVASGRRAVGGPAAAA